ncbi:hypothetical protein STEG23_032622, partial [Scotinomys teguina]
TQGSSCGNSPLPDVPNPIQIWSFKASASIFIICIRVLVEKFSSFGEILTKTCALAVGYDMCKNGRQPSQ